MTIESADRHARTHPRGNSPPHWLRCDETLAVEGELYRCLLGSGHGGKCKFEDAAPHDLGKIA